LVTETTTKAAADALEEAEDMLASLTGAKIKGEARLRELNATRAALSYAGLSPTGTGEDRVRLAQTTEEAIRLGAELDNLGFGIVTAKKRVDEARKFVGSEVVRLKAETAQQHLADWRSHGGRAGTLFAEFLAEFDAAVAAASAIRRLRICRFPDHETLDVSLKLALQGELFRRRLHPEPVLTPRGSRRELGEIIEIWAAQTDIALARVISGEAPPPVEPEELPPPPPRIAGEEFLADEAAE
jgi:hypothetical protein